MPKPLFWRVSRPGVEGEIFNVVDDELPTGRQFLESYKKRCRALRSFAFLIRSRMRSASYGRNTPNGQRTRFPLSFNRRRCAAEWKGNGYSNRKLRQSTGWEPNGADGRCDEAFLGQFGPTDNAMSASQGSGSQTSEAALPYRL